MKILVLTDIHSSERAIDIASRDIEEHAPELLIICGDITHFGPGSFAEKFLDSISIKTLAVPGNCDPPEVLRVLEDRNVSLHGKTAEIGSFIFVGLGGSNKTPFNSFTEFTEDYIFAALDRVMVENAILVTHVPTKGYLDGPSPSEHYGSEAVAKIVDKYRPRVAISGHIHEARGVTRDKGTLFFNPGPAMRGNRAILSLTEERTDVELLD